MYIDFDNEYITLKSCQTPINTLETKRETEYYNYTGKACITYDEKKEEVLDYGQDPNFKPKDEYVHVNRFIEKIRRYHELGENWRKTDDIFAIEAISKFLQKSLTESIYYREITRKNPRAFHYIVIIPSEWEPIMREYIIRELFITADIISKDDHADRLLFYTHLEATFYYLERFSRNMDTKLYEEGQRSILCRISSDKEGSLALHLDVIEPKKSSFDTREEFLELGSISQAFVSLSLLGFKEDIGNLIKSTISIESNAILDLMVNHILNYFSEKTTFWYDRATTYDPEKLFWNIDLDDWNLTGPQQEMFNKITVSEVCDIIDNHIVRGLEKLLKGVSVTSRTLTLAFIYGPPSETHTHPWIPWVEKVLERKEKFTNSKYLPMMNAQEPGDHITLSALMEETIPMSKKFLYSYVDATISYSQDNLEGSEKPSDVYLSSAYPEIKLNAIINIDISLKSTIVSFLELDENGDIRNVFDDKFFDIDKQALSLDRFLDISNITTLKLTKDGFDSIEEIFPHYLEYFKIKTILSTDFFFEQDSDCTRQQNHNTQQQKHIRVFLVVYLAYLKDVILKKNLEFETELEIGYVVSIERMLLDNAIGTKSDFEEIVSASGIVESEGTSNYLKVITRGEGLLPLLQRRYKISKLSLDSYFLLANIHENYIQFTLNKVVVVGDSEIEASSIVIKDKIISIENIYDSLCMNVWNCVVKTESLIILCEEHELQSAYQVQELFSFDAREEFFKSLKSYMSKDDFGSTSDDRLTMSLTDKCRCVIDLNMNSMIEIAWKPTFKSLATTLSSSLENLNLFGLYYNINYLFGLIHFNQSSEYQKRIAYLLSTELNSKLIGKETSARCFIIEDFPAQFLHPKIDPKIDQKPPVFSQASFQRGNVTVVSKDSYGYSIVLPGSGIYDTIVPSKKDEKLGVVRNTIYKERAFLLLKKGDAIDRSGLEKSFSLEKKPKEKPKDDVESKDNIEPKDDVEQKDGIKHEDIVRICHIDKKSTIPLDNMPLEKLKIFELTNYKYNHNMPIIISVKPKSHLSSLYFSVKVKGQDVVLKENYLALNHSTKVAALKTHK
ncbi:hypothetical protein HPULCUR_004705 [Helicostylum pulchrum]|uniref:Uncharacterized protein n=1 Tax=Helicostylum pulchrum TaxID=562976 RepID=A0ABP9XX19_9FUNG